MAAADLASRLMSDFLERTGVTSARPQRRYLWTDAFAVCNLLALGQPELALRLIDRVHHVLGRHRPDDPRTGWLSGLTDPEGEQHPTRGGLRIGKELPERRESEAFDERLEWERDGQYFHYLTRWMHALHQTARATGRRQLNFQARELMLAAQAFVRGGRMVWKMSVDLSRPLVPSMGQHDPLDGYVTCAQLLENAGGDGPDLKPVLRTFADLIAGRRWTTTDPLGLGGLLSDALRLQQLIERAALPDEMLLHAVLEDAARGLRHRRSTAPEPLWARLAFRELGLAIGLHAAELMRERKLSAKTRALVDAVLPDADAALAIESFWISHREDAGWADHRDINDVMLATSLLPRGYLEL